MLGPLEMYIKPNHQLDRVSPTWAHVRVGYLCSSIMLSKLTYAVA